MAVMIPDILPDMIENNGERMFYVAASKLPSEYTVFYSYKYFQREHDDHLLREADFVVVHPSLGYAVFEVKQGEAAYMNGTWQEFKQGRYQPLKKDPQVQATTAMYDILSLYKNKSGGRDFPLRIRFALCFPECNVIAGHLPPSLREGSVWTAGDLERMEEKLFQLFDIQDRRSERQAAELLIDRVLSPAFKLFSSLESKLEAFHAGSKLVLTEEQERILDETEDDRRKIFLGAAGTGKTYIAMEKAKRCAAQGKRVFLTCYNKYLVTLFERMLGDSRIEAMHFHGYLEVLLHRERRLVDAPAEADVYFNEYLPNQAYDYYADLPNEEKFDVIIIDEGQDFKEEWLLCLEEMLKPNGELYIFADPNQNLFNNAPDVLAKYNVSRHRLTYNLRNSEKINDWTTPLTDGRPMRSRLSGGIPVTEIAWISPQEEKRLLEKEIGRLVSQGLQPKRIVILSPHRQENSCLAGATKIKEWPLVPFEEGEAGIRFATIRAFKGLESDAVMLIGIREGSRVCTPADIYVGASRSRYLLYVFHQAGWRLR